MYMRTTGRKSGSGKQNGRWTQEEHTLFLRALDIYGREWKKVETYVKTRSSAQIRSHAQKYFAKLEKEAQNGVHGGAAEIHGEHVVLSTDSFAGGRKRGRKRSSAGSATTTAGKGKGKRKRANSSVGSTSASAAAAGVGPAGAASFRPPVMGLLYPPMGLGSRGGSLPRPAVSVSAGMGSGLVGLTPFVAGHGQRIALRSPGTGTGTSTDAGGNSPTEFRVPRVPAGISPDSSGSRPGRVVSPKTARVRGGRISPVDFDPLLDADTEAISALLRQRETTVRDMPAKAPVDPARYQRIELLDAELIRVLAAADRKPCMCRRLCHIVHCRDARTGASPGEVVGCLTVRRNLLFLTQSSLVAYPAATADSQRLLAMWRAVNDEIYTVETAADAIRIDQTANIYNGMSEVAQTRLQDLDMTELTAVQVLVGTRMGLKPRRSPIRVESVRSIAAAAATHNLPGSRTESPVYHNENGEPASPITKRLRVA